MKKEYEKKFWNGTSSQLGGDEELNSCMEEWLDYAINLQNAADHLRFVADEISVKARFIENCAVRGEEYDFRLVALSWGLILRDPLEILK